MIYADNAATTKLDVDAFEAMKPFLFDQFANASQPYSFSRSAKKALKEARIVIAECINASPEEIYFTSGGTEGDNWAIKGVISASNDKQTIITSTIEHHAIINACKAMENDGVNVIYVPVDEKGIVDSNSLRKKLTSNINIVSIMLANNEIGTIEPVGQIADIVHEFGTIFHTDAVQALGHIKVDVKELDVDILSASGHKFNAPKGVGFVYVKNGTDIKPYADGGAQERGMRAGTENVAAIVAMAVALKKNCDSMETTTLKLKRMEEQFIKTLDASNIEYLRNGSNHHVPGNISISIKNASGEALLHCLDLKGICVSTGSACDSKNTQLSHVIKAIGVPKDYAHGTIRISFGRDNEEQDAIEVAKTIIDILK